MPFASTVAVLVGRNNVGKSSIIDIFEFIKDASLDPNKAVQTRGADASHLVWGKSPNEEVDVVIDFDVPKELRETALQSLTAKHPTEPNGTGVVTRLTRENVVNSRFLTTLRYSLCFGHRFIESVTTTDPVAPARQYPLAERAGIQELFVTYWDSRNALWNHEGGEISLPPNHTSQTYNHKTIPPLLFADYGVKTDSEFAFTWLRDFFHSSYRSSPTRKPDHTRNITSTQTIENDGRNLADVLNAIRNNDDATFRAIEADLKQLVTGVDGLSTPTTGAMTTTRVREISGEKSLFFDLNQLSAGTVQLLVLLTQLHTRPKNSLVLLEEVESMLHPHAQATFYAILKGLSSAITILISTHSPIIASESRTDSLFLVKKQDGESSVHPYAENTSDEIIYEMGIRPSYNLEANTVVFVEGPFDVAVFRAWLDAAGICKTVHLIDSGGYSKIQFLANAKILRSRVVRTNVFAVVDGDTRRKGDYVAIKHALEIDDVRIFELATDNLEGILARADAIRAAFGSLTFEDGAIAAEPRELKSALNRVLRPVGGYTEENAAKIAAKIEPPAEWKKFFESVEAEDIGLSASSG